MKKIFSAMLVLMIGVAIFTGCGVRTPSANEIQRQQAQDTINIGAKLAESQPTPKDIDYSLQRYVLIKRAYWVNGQREKAISLTAPIEVPIGYCLLLTEQGEIIGEFMVEGKVSSLNNYLTPDSEYYERNYGSGSGTNHWLPDVDGSFGYNDDGIFFFTPDGKYIEWSGTYLYSDIPFNVENTIIKNKK